MLNQKKLGALAIVDPVLGDNALLDVKTVYSDRMTELIGGMRELCEIADTITPNLTESCLLLEREYPTSPLTDPELIEILNSLMDLGAKSVLIQALWTHPIQCVWLSVTVMSFIRLTVAMCVSAVSRNGRPFDKCVHGARLSGYSVVNAANLAVDFGKGDRTYGEISPDADTPRRLV